MRKDTYAYLDGIPDRTSDLYNDGGFLNESEVQAEIGNYLDIDDATAGQVLTMGESGFPEWEDVAGGGITYSNEEQATNDVWIDGRPIYQKSFTIANAVTAGDNVACDFGYMIDPIDITWVGTWYDGNNYHGYIPVGKSSSKNYVTSVGKLNVYNPLDKMINTNSVITVKYIK